MFAKNVLTRKIMTLHGNTEDLLFVYKSVYDCGQISHVEVPIFYDCYNTLLPKID